MSRALSDDLYIPKYLNIRLGALSRDRRRTEFRYKKFVRTINRTFAQRFIALQNRRSKPRLGNQSRLLEIEFLLLIIVVASLVFLFERVEMSQPFHKIKIKCPQCEKEIRAPTKMAGRTGKCPGCGNKITIPVLTSSGDDSRSPPVPAAEVLQSTQATKLGSASSTSQLASSSAVDSSSGNESSESRGKRLNLWGQAVFLLLFVTAMFSLGILRQNASTRLLTTKTSLDAFKTFLLYVNLGVCFGMIAWASSWFVLHTELFWKRVIGMVVVMANATVALLAGIMITGGAGPISVKEAWAGSPGIPMLFLAFHLPLWGFTFFKQKLIWQSEKAPAPTKTQAMRIFVTNTVVGVGLVIATVFCAYIARFPGVNSAISWGIVVPSLAIAGLATSLPAVLVAWRIKRGWLSLMLTIVHIIGCISIVYLAIFLGFIRERPPIPLESCTAVGAFMVALYAPLMLGRFCGYRLTNPNKLTEAKPVFPITKFDQSAFGLACIFPLVLFLGMLAISVRPVATQSLAPPTALVPMVRTLDSRDSVSMGIVLAKQEGKAYIYAYPWPGTNRRNDEVQPDVAEFWVAVGGERVPAELVSSKLYYRFPSSSGTFRGSIFSVDESKVPDPATFGDAMDCNEKDILGVAGWINQKQEDGSFAMFQDDLRIDYISRPSSNRGHGMVTANRTTGSKQRNGIAYNDKRELVGLGEAVHDPKKDSVMYTVKGRHLKELISACSQHIPGFGEKTNGN